MLNVRRLLIFLGSGAIGVLCAVAVVSISSPFVEGLKATGSPLAPAMEGAMVIEGCAAFFACTFVAANAMARVLMPTGVPEAWQKEQRHLTAVMRVMSGGALFAAEVALLNTGAPAPWHWLLATFSLVLVFSGVLLWFRTWKEERSR